MSILGQCVVGYLQFDAHPWRFLGRTELLAAAQNTKSGGAYEAGAILVIALIILFPLIVAAVGGGSHMLARR